MVAALAGIGKGRKLKMPDMPGSPLAVGLIVIGGLIATAAYKGTINDVIAALGGRAVGDAKPYDGPVFNPMNDLTDDGFRVYSWTQPIQVKPYPEDTIYYVDLKDIHPCTNDQDGDVMIAIVEGVETKPGEIWCAVRDDLLSEDRYKKAQKEVDDYKANGGTLPDEKTPKEKSSDSGGYGPHVSLGIIGRDYRVNLARTGKHEGMMR